MRAGKAQAKLQRELVRSDGRETRRVRRARWAALGHDRPTWRPLKIIASKSYAMWQAEEAERKRIEREMRRQAVLSMAHSVTARIAAFVTRKPYTPSPPRRQQAR